MFDNSVGRFEKKMVRYQVCFIIENDPDAVPPQDTVFNVTLLQVVVPGGVGEEDAGEMRKLPMVSLG